MNVDVLIEEVEKRPILWDSSLESYKDRFKKKEAWMQICEVLYENFNTTLQSEQELAAIGVISKWRTIRDNYIRSLKKHAEAIKSGSGRKMVRYIYEDQLQFLQKTQERPVSQIGSEIKCEQAKLSSIKDEYSGSDRDDDDHLNDFTCIDDEHESITNTLELISPTNRKSDSKVNSNNTPRYHLEDILMQSNKKPRYDTNSENMENTTEVEPNKRPRYDLENEDMVFFSSLLSTLQSLKPKDKLQFRIEVLQTLQKYIPDESSP